MTPENRKTPNERDRIKRAIRTRVPLRIADNKTKRTFQFADYFPGGQVDDGELPFAQYYATLIVD